MLTTPALAWPMTSTLDTHELLENALGRPKGPYDSRLRKINWPKNYVILGLAVLLAWRLTMICFPNWMNVIPEQWHFFLSAGFPALWMIVFPYLVAKQRGVKNLCSDLDTGHIVKETLITIPVVIFVLVVLAVVSSIRVYFGGEPLGSPQETAMRTDVIALLLLSVTVTPLAEELFFRGFLYNSLRRKSGVYWALLVQAVIFALMHSYTPGRMVAVAFLGLALGAVYEWRKTLVSPVIIHASINLFAAVATILVLLVQLSTPYLGVRGQSTEKGYVIQELETGGPADRAGLQAGDRIIAIAGVQPDALEGIALELNRHEIGETIPVRVQRGGRQIDLQVTLEERPRD